MALNTLTMVFGASETPSTLTLDNVKTLMIAAEDPNCDMVLGGYAKVNEPITENQYNTLTNKGLNIVNTIVQQDMFSIQTTTGSWEMLEGNSVTFKSTGIALENLNFTFEVTSVTGLPTQTLRNRIHIDGNVLTVDPADENVSWTGYIRVTATAKYNEGTKQNATITVRGIAVTGVNISGANEVNGGSNETYTFAVVPANNTKSYSNIAWSAVSGNITGTNTASYRAPLDAAEDTITCSLTYYGTTVEASKTVSVGLVALDAFTNNVPLFNIVHEVLGDNESVTQYTALDLKSVTNANATAIIDKVKETATPESPISLEEFKFFTSVKELSSTNENMLYTNSIKFPSSLTKITGSVLTFDGSLIPNVNLKEMGANGITLSENVFAGSTIKKLDLDGVIAVELNRIGICAGVSTLEEVNIRSITDWSSESFALTLSGQGYFQNCVGLTKVITDNPRSWKVSPKMFAGCSNLEYFYDQEGHQLPEFVSKISSDYIRDSFSGCQSLRISSLPTTVKRLLGSAFANCLYLTADHELPYLYEISSDAFTGCTRAFTSGVFDFGSLSIDKTITLPATGFTPVNASKVILNSKAVSTITKTLPADFRGNYNNITEVDATACTKLDIIYYSALYAFRNATITFNTVSVPVLSGYDDSVEFTGTIKVPSSLLSAWKTADNWNRLADKIVAA